MYARTLSRACHYLVLDGLAQGLFQAVEDDKLLHLGKHEGRDRALPEARELGVLLKVLHDSNCETDGTLLRSLTRAHAPGARLD